MGLINTATLPLILLIMIGLLAVMLGLIIYLLVANIQLKKRVDRFMGSRSEKHNIEAMLLGHMEMVKGVDEKYDGLVEQIGAINTRLNQCLQKVALIRYNPFDSMGGDISFVLALLDDNNSGVVINTIHGRDASYTYAKPIVALESVYTLSEEEKKALQMASEQ